MPTSNFDTLMVVEFIIPPPTYDCFFSEDLFFPNIAQPIFNDVATPVTQKYLPSTYTIQGFILPDTNILYQKVLVVIDNDDVAAEFKSTLNKNPSGES